MGGSWLLLLFGTVVHVASGKLSAENDLLYVSVHERCADVSATDLSDGSLGDTVGTFGQHIV